MNCVAYSSSNVQYNNICIGDSYHCELHRNKAKSLYIKYKMLCSKCDDDFIDTYQIK